MEMTKTKWLRKEKLSQTCARLVDRFKIAIGPAIPARVAPVRVGVVDHDVGHVLQRQHFAGTTVRHPHGRRGRHHRWRRRRRRRAVVVVVIREIVVGIVVGTGQVGHNRGTGGRGRTRGRRRWHAGRGLTLMLLVANQFILFLFVERFVLKIIPPVKPSYSTRKLNRTVPDLPPNYPSPRCPNRLACHSPC